MPGGRPSKLTPDIQRQICDLLLAGNFAQTVCDFVGIHVDTFHEWMNRGERGWKIDEEGGYTEFSEAVKKAVAQVEMTTIYTLRQGDQYWQRYAWWLERRHPDKWGNRQKHVHSGPDDKPIETEHSGELILRVTYGDDGTEAPASNGTDNPAA